MYVLPALNPAKDGVNVTMRQRIKGAAKVALSRIVQDVLRYPRPRKVDEDPTVNAYYGTGPRTLTGTKTRTTTWRTHDLSPKDPVLLGNARNPSKLFFITFDDPVRYNEIDYELWQAVRAGHLDILSTVITP